jgi:AcrR family transcriptional regulator
MIPTGRYHLFNETGERYVEIENQFILEVTLQQRSEETRGRILEAALRLFSQSGYDATGVAEICQAASVSKGAFYHHFPTKQLVFYSLLNDWMGGLDQQLSVFRRQDQPVSQTLVQMASMTKSIFQEADQKLPMFLEFWTQASRDPAVWQATIEPYHRYQEFFTLLVQQGITEGSLRNEDPATVAKIIVALALGLLLQGLLDPQGANWDLVAQKGMQILIDGIKN